MTLHLFWADHDRSRAITTLGLVGLAVAAAMAVYGLPPVDLHGPLHYRGIMDPLCGGTRAARLAVQGHLGAAWRYNPLGIMAVIAAAGFAVRCAIGLTTRRWLSVEVRWTPRALVVAVVAATALMVLLEVRQQGRADLLMQRY